MPDREQQEKQAMLAKEISALSEFRIGSLFYRRRRCGKTGCKCADPKHPGHGCWVVVKRRGKGTAMSTVQEDAVARVREQLVSGHRFWRLCAEYAEITDELTKSRLYEEAGAKATAKKGGSKKPLPQKSRLRSRRS